ncbi:MAG: hypothetical protein IPK60_06205 [Sandaracinaceae bacterium]|nr:hypothetical protein [Sandaracinaceae bacterium]
MAEVHTWGPVSIGALTLALGRVRFPISLGAGGAARFRTRHTTIDSISMQLDLPKLLGIAKEKGVVLRVYGVNESGRVACALMEDNVVVAFEATVVALDADIGVLVENERRVVEDGVPAWQRIARAMHALSASFDEQRGVFVWKRALRIALTQTLCRYGWRLPDERALHLRVDVPNAHAVLIHDASVASATQAHAGALEQARVLSQARAWLAQGEAARALAALSDIPSFAKFGALRERYAARIALDAGDEADVQLEAGYDVALRLAVRAGDADAAANAAHHLDADEAVHEFVASALRLAAAAQPEARAAVRAELLERACARAPADAAIASAALRAVSVIGDAQSVDKIARRALASIPDRESRIALLMDAGDALLGLGESSAARSLWKEAARLDPQNPLLWMRLGDVDAEANPATALLAYERAALAWIDDERPEAAAEAYGLAAKMLTHLGRYDSALARIVSAATLNPNDVRWHTESAVRYTQMEATTEARRAFNEVLRFASVAEAEGGLRAGVEFHLAQADAAAARVFLDALVRLTGSDADVSEYKTRLARLVAETWMRVSTRVPELDAGGIVDMASDASAPAEAAESLLASFLSESDPEPEVTRSLLGAALIAANRAHNAQLSARVAETAALHVHAFDDPHELEALEQAADAPAARATFARRSATLYRAQNKMGEAALALGRAGVARNDAATIRAAIEGAARAGAWHEAIALVDSALALVGDGPARGLLLTRREELTSAADAKRE